MCFSLVVLVAYFLTTYFSFPAKYTPPSPYAYARNVTSRFMNGAATLVAIFVYICYRCQKGWVSAKMLISIRLSSGHRVLVFISTNMLVTLWKLHSGYFPVEFYTVSGFFVTEHMREAQLRMPNDSRQPTGRRCYMFCVAVWQAQTRRFKAKFNDKIFGVFCCLYLHFFNQLCSYVRI